MTTQPAHDPQRDRPRDLFAAFAASLYPNSPSVALAVRLTLAQLCQLTDPMSGHVLDAIHAERRRRLSAATREGRRAG